MPANMSFVVQGVLAGSARPRSESDISALAESGFGGLLSLTERPLELRAVKRAGVEYLHLPVEDFTAPSLSAVERAVEFVRRVAAGKKPVLVHCGSGYGRTGTVLACYLVAEGAEPDEAIAEVRRKRPGSIETAEQEDLVHLWADRCRRR